LLLFLDSFLLLLLFFGSLFLSNFRFLMSFDLKFGLFHLFFNCHIILNFLWSWLLFLRWTFSIFALVIENIVLRRYIYTLILFIFIWNKSLVKHFCHFIGTDFILLMPYHRLSYAFRLLRFHLNDIYSCINLFFMTLLFNKVLIWSLLNFLIEEG
jgi:hypothetical protein